MRRIVVKLEYDGTDFQGWQLQADGRTVQGVFENAVRKATGAENRVAAHGAGRTDSGVHAEGQVAHFDTESALASDVMVRALNYWLPRDVSALAAQEAPEGFHARFSASSKLYRYRVLPSRAPRPLRERYCLLAPGPLDLEAMQRCAADIVGRHDFASFTTEKQEGQDTERTVFSSRWEVAEDELQFYIEADGFLYNMVRALVGTMLEVGRGKHTPDNFENILQKKDRRKSGPTAPPHGLTLLSVKYAGPYAGLLGGEKSPC